MLLTRILRFATVIVATAIPTVSVAQDPASIMARQNELGTSINGVETCLRNYDGGFRTSMSCVLAFCKMWAAIGAGRKAFEDSQPLTATEAAPIVTTYGEVNQDVIAALGAVSTKVPVITRAGMLTFGTVVIRGLAAERNAFDAAALAKVPSDFHDDLVPLVDPVGAAFNTALTALGGSLGPLDPVLPGN